jgi:outer membrane protein assembly factor BamB/predicted negative regulator of RcsB-dependent stress response
MSADNEVTQTVGELRAEQWKQYRAALPTLHPLVVGDTVLVRTASQLAAVDLSKGEVLWQAGLEDSLRQRLQIKAKAATSLKSGTFTEALRRRFWDDLSFGTLSSDGQYVFGVEDVSFGSWQDEQCMVVGPDGQRRMDNDALKKHNLLTAHDVRTGKLAWEIGGLPGTDSGPLGGATFLGPPLPLGGRLYVVADVNKETRLIEIDGRSGALLNELTLALRERSPADNNGMVIFGGVQPESQRLDPVASSSPSYSDGVLVCRASENQYIAVSLATRSVLWVYQMPEPEISGMGWMFGMMRQKQLLDALDPNPADRWSDGSVTIAAGRVLLTPPDASDLYCLDLHDGRLLWSAPRRDGLYVGGVADGRVLVVGRGGLWALDLDDGTSAWKPTRLLLPAGALPSGRGLLSQGQYLLPLSTGEVAAVDMKKGRLVSRSRSPEHIVPGNLIAYRDAVLAQGVDGLWRFDSLSVRDGQLTAALRERPDDPDLLAERGAVLLGNGQIAEAVTLLRQAMEKKPSPQTRQWLADALLDGLRADFETFAPQAEQLDTLIEQSEGRQQYLRELAGGWQDAGRPKAAFDALLKLIDATDKPQELARYETARLIRRERWLAARIDEVRAAAAPAEREEMDKRIAARLRDDKLREFLAYFGSHPAANDARLRLAQQAIEKQEWAAAEQWLRAVTRSGSAAQQNTAIARLASLLRETKQTDDAARCYDILRGRLAQTACLDGKTGDQLFAALAENDPVRHALAVPAKWPKGKVRVEAPDKPNNNGNNSQRVPLALYWEEDPLGTPFTVEVDMNHRKIAASDGLGRKRWEVSMADKDGQWQFVHYPDASSQIWPLGHLQVAWIGNRVAAIDTLGEKAKVLWTQEPFKMHPQFGWIGFPLRMRARMMGQQMQPTALPASEPLPLVVTPQGVVFLQNRTLRAFDPLGGQELWNRDDVTPDSNLFGDDELLLVTPPDSVEAVVYSVMDGREIGRCSVPPLAERLWTAGRRVVAWKALHGRMRVSLVDPWAGQTLWQRDFADKAQPWLIDAGELAVLEPDGLFTTVSLLSGEPLMQAQVDAVPQLEGIWAERLAGQYTLIARDPSVGKNVQTMMQQFNGSYAVTGRVYGLDRRTGKLLWTTNVDKQGIRLGQPADVPVLTFFTQGNVLEGNQYRGYAALLCLDKRNGRVLHSKESKNHHPQFFETDVDLAKSIVDLRTPLGPVKLTFTDEAEDAKPAEKK